MKIRNNRFGPLLGVSLLLSVGACSWMPDIDLPSMPSIGGGGSNAPLGETVTGVSTRAEQSDPLRNKGVTSNSDFAGAVVADEPNAALIARNILEGGGNAADAATALYFALSVTYPAAAGLGGGGVCIAHDSNRTESIGFLPRRAASGGAVAVPGNVRGFAALQARYGSVSWSELVAPAERLAAVGMPASRATAGQLGDAALIILSNPQLAALFATNGSPLKELDTLKQLNLATTLALIRSQTTNGFYGGSTASLLVAESGGALSLDDLKNYRPEISPAQTVASGAMSVALPATSLGAGTFASAVWQNVGGVGNASEVAAAGERAASSLGASGAASDGDYGSTSFAVVDGKGGAVACSVTMNGAFGTARVAHGSGVVFAAAPPSGKSLGSAFLMPVVISSASGKSVYFAGAGAGAPKGAASISYAAQSVLNNSSSLADALNASAADARSPANAIACSKGLPGAGVCTIAVNPKGNGVGFSAVSPDS